MSQNPAFDSSIPVLTEVVMEPLVLEPVPGSGPAEPEAKAAEPIGEPSTPTQAAPDWDELERRIAERVVQQLQSQIDAVVRGALAAANEQIRQGVRQAVEQVVAQQVAAVQFGQK